MGEGLGGNVTSNPPEAGAHEGDAARGISKSPRPRGCAHGPTRAHQHAHRAHSGTPPLLTPQTSSSNFSAPTVEPRRSPRRAPAPAPARILRSSPIAAVNVPAVDGAGSIAGSQLDTANSSPSS